MKASGGRQVHYESGPNMTPLVDVVMVILIFLMLAGSFGSAEHYMIGSADVRSSGPSRRGPDIPVPPVVMDVYVLETGDVRLAWETAPLRAVPPDPGETRPFSLRLAEPIAAKYTEVVASPEVQSRRQDGKIPEDEVEVIIHANGKVKWELLAPAYDAALQAKVRKIGFR